MRMPLSGKMSSAASVICQLMDSIITATPTAVASELTTCDRLWLSVWVMVSTSLVMRLSTSPLETLSK